MKTVAPRDRGTLVQTSPRESLKSPVNWMMFSGNPTGEEWPEKGGTWCLPRPSLGPPPSGPGKSWIVGPPIQCPSSLHFCGNSNLQNMCLWSVSYLTSIYFFAVLPDYFATNQKILSYSFSPLNHLQAKLFLCRRAWGQRVGWRRVSACHAGLVGQL